MSLELVTAFPKLRFVVQDRRPVIEQGRGIWVSRMPRLISNGHVSLQVHDFFQEQPIRGADIYFLRYIL